jgi:hypothetical protein
MLSKAFYFIVLMNLTFLINSAINLASFDVREKFNDCFHETYSSNTNLVCNTNWPIQFTLVASDKLCINSNYTIKTISPQNIISCLNFNSTPYNCKNQFTFDGQMTYDLISNTVEYFNQNGSQLLSESPYSFNETTGEFPKCSSYNSSLGKLFLSGFDFLDETSDLELIKTLLITEGSILAYTNGRIKFNLSNITNKLLFRRIIQCGHNFSLYW